MVPAGSRSERRCPTHPPAHIRYRTRETLAKLHLPVVQPILPTDTAAERRKKRARVPEWFHKMNRVVQGPPLQVCPTSNVCSPSSSVRAAVR